MTKLAKLRARILALYWREEWHWHGSGKSLTVHNVNTGETHRFRRVE